MGHNQAGDRADKKQGHASDQWHTPSHVIGCHPSTQPSPGRLAHGVEAVTRKSNNVGGWLFSKTDNCSQPSCFGAEFTKSFTGLRTQPVLPRTAESSQFPSFCITSSHSVAPGIPQHTSWEASGVQGMMLRPSSHLLFFNGSSKTSELEVPLPERNIILQENHLSSRTIYHNQPTAFSAHSSSISTSVPFSASTAHTNWYPNQPERQDHKGGLASKQVLFS